MNFSTFCKKSLYVTIASTFFAAGVFAHDDDKPKDPPGDDHTIVFFLPPEFFEQLRMEMDDKEIKEKETTTKSDETTTPPPIDLGKIEEKIHEKKALDLSGVLYPDEIFSYLTQYTIGQEEAMKSLSTFVHEHLITRRLREAALENPEDVDLKNLKLVNPNILMMGPTGTGKTSSVELISKLLNVPFATGNATEWTAQGYIGGKCQDVFEKLVSNSRSLLNKEKKNTGKAAVIKAASHGIVFIDEIDKICNKSAGELEVIDRVQQELLPIIQGTDLKLNSGDTLDTSNILFIAGGAFPGLILTDDDIGKEVAPSRKRKRDHDVVTPGMLEAYGMLPELAGRLCNIVQFSPLSKESLKRIVLNSKNSFLQQYIQKYKMAYQIDLSFADSAIDYIVEAASRQKTGARAINSMVYRIMEDKTFNIRKHIGKPMVIDIKDAKEALNSFVNEPVKKDNISHQMMYM